VVFVVWGGRVPVVVSHAIQVSMALTARCPAAVIMAPSVTQSPASVTVAPHPASTDLSAKSVS